jgi:Protein of unknown function (DUF2971)
MQKCRQISLWKSAKSAMARRSYRSRIVAALQAAAGQSSNERKAPLGNSSACRTRRSDKMITPYVSEANPRAQTMAQPEHPIPEILFHYCSVETLLSILSDMTIRMSPLTSLNDYMEHSWLRKIAIDYINDLTRKRPNSILDPKDVVSDFLFAARLSLNVLKPVVPYCACFSSDGDVLSQWRAYASDAKGVAVGFRSASLPDFDHTSLKAVVYDQQKHITIVDTLIREFTDELTDKKSKDDLQSHADDFYVQLLEPSMYCKNPAFSEEKEWRIVHEPVFVDIPGTKKTLQIGPATRSGYRIRDDRLIRYLDVQFDARFAEKTISELVLGPKNPMSDDDETLKQLLQERGYGHVTVRKSRATYR